MPCEAKLVFVRNNSQRTIRASSDSALNPRRASETFIRARIFWVALARECIDPECAHGSGVVATTEIRATSRNTTPRIHDNN